MWLFKPRCDDKEKQRGDRLQALVYERTAELITAQNQLKESQDGYGSLLCENQAMQFQILGLRDDWAALNVKHQDLQREVEQAKQVQAELESAKDTIAYLDEQLVAARKLADDRLKQIETLDRVNTQLKDDLAKASVGTVAAIAERMIAWHKDRFPDATKEQVARKFHEEFGEYVREVYSGFSVIAELAELADVFLCMIALSYKNGGLGSGRIQFGILQKLEELESRPKNVRANVAERN